MATETFDVEKYLKTEFREFNQEAEVDRILKIADLDESPLDLLELDLKNVYAYLSIDLKLVKQIYRKRSLLVHPDRNKHEKAKEAFEILKRAEANLGDNDKRNSLIKMIKEARENVFRNEKVAFKSKPKSSILLGEEREEVDPKLIEEAFNKNPRLVILVKLEVRKVVTGLQKRKEIFVKNEITTKMKELLDAGHDRKRKAAEQKIWEETRDDRVVDWRSFNEKNAKKKLKKAKKFM